MSEIEDTLERVKNHEGVEGYVIVDSDGQILRNMPGMDADLVKKYGEVIQSLAVRAQSVVRDIDPTNKMEFLRLRTKREIEILIAPHDDFMVIIIQKWIPAESDQYA